MDEKLRDSRRCFVPLLKNKAIEITIRYADGEEQGWINRYREADREPDQICVINVDVDGSVEIIIVYEGGDVQLQEFRKDMEEINFFSKNNNTHLLVTKRDGVKVKVEPGFVQTYHRKNEEGIYQKLVLRGHSGTNAEMIGKWLTVRQFPDTMILSKDYNSKMEKHVSGILSSVDQMRDDGYNSGYESS